MFPKVSKSAKVQKSTKSIIVNIVTILRVINLIAKTYSYQKTFTK